MNFFPYDLKKGNTPHLSLTHATHHEINSLLLAASLLLNNLPKEIKESLSTEQFKTTEETWSPSVFLCSL